MARYRIVRVDVKKDTRTDTGKEYITKTEATSELNVLNSRVRDPKEAYYEIEEQ